MPGAPPTLIHLAEVDSTQAFLQRNLHLVPCAVVADRQTAGQGRQGRRWEGAPGAGLFLSVALPSPAGLLPGLALQWAMARAAALLDPGGRVLGLKWPNDLVAWRSGSLAKVGGILGEQGGGRLLLGLGVNLSVAPVLPERDIPAASLADLGLPVPDRLRLAALISTEWMGLAEEPRIPFRWPEAGQAFRWEGGQGTCLGWEPDGRLKVATAQGIERLTAGVVRGLQGPSGSPRP